VDPGQEIARLAESVTVLEGDQMRVSVGVLVLAEDLTACLEAYQEEVFEREVLDMGYIAQGGIQTQKQVLEKAGLGSQVVGRIVAGGIVEGTENLGVSRQLVDCMVADKLA